MYLVVGLLHATGVYPLLVAWRAHRQTSLTHALAWAVLAWLGWGVALAANDSGMATATRYFALALTGCAGVAVLGARRPGVTAWNFVVGGLLVVLALSLLESFFIRGGVVQPGGVRAFFLAGTLAVGTLNYVPTRVGLAAALLAVACGLELADLLGGGVRFRLIVDVLVVLVPWTAWLATRSHRERSPADRLWLDFRDRFGFVWGQRLREQFNRSATHANLPAELTWTGLRFRDGAAAETQAASFTTLQALMKRFGRAEETP